MTDRDKDAPPIASEVMRRHWSQFDAELQRAMPDPSGALEAQRAAKLISPVMPALKTVSTDASNPTPYAVSINTRIPAAAAKLRRSTIRITYTSMARELGVDRDTLSRWIARGWVAWPPS